MTLRGAAIVLALLVHTAAAGSFRGASVSWRTPDPAGAPNTVEISVTTIWDSPTIDATTADLDFGDGMAATGLTGSIIYSGTTDLGAGYSVQQTTVTHAYAAAGTYAIVLSGCCRHATTNQTDPNAPFRLTATVVLGTGMTHSPAMLTLHAAVMSNAPEFLIPTALGDTQAPSAREASLAESGLTIPQPAPSVSISQLVYSVYVNLNASQVTGDTLELAFVIADARGGSGAIDVIAEVATQSYGCSSDLWEVGGLPGSAIQDHGLIGTSSSIGVANLPGATVVVQPFMAGMEWLVTWTPADADLGTWRVALVEIALAGGTAECGFSVYVEPQVDECTNGTSDCAKVGSYCRDTPWGYTCACNAFFMGDGKTCKAYCGPSPYPVCLVNGQKTSAYCCGAASGGPICTCPNSGSGSTPPSSGGGCDAGASGGWLLALLALRPRRRR